MSLLRTILFALAALIAATSAHAQIAFRNAAAAATDSIAEIGASAAASDDGGCPRSVTPAIPGGANGDLLIALVNSREDSATIAASGTWTQLYAATYGGGGQDFEVYLYYRFATGADAFTFTQSGTCGSLAAQVSRFRGVDPAQPLETSPIPAGNVVQQNSGDLDTGTQTTTLDGSMLLVAGFVNDNRTVSEGAGWAESFDSSFNLNRDLGVSLHYLPQVTAGPASISNWDLSGGGNDENFGVIFALRPAGLRIPVPAGTLANDVMIATVAARPCSGSSGGACSTTITPPAGWTLINSFDQTTGGGTGGFGNILHIYRRVATGAEPAAYTWRFGGTPVNNGAIGGILSFSGVDTTNPVVAEAGQLTPNSTSHAAPGINTGIVTDTMLVASHAANSSTTWSSLDGMTSSVDGASLPVPDALGIGMSMFYQPQAAAGPTGTRTAQYSSGAAGDTGAAHLLALRPLPAVNHYAMSVVSTTVANCDFAEVTITAHNAAHTLVNPPVTRTVTLSVSAGAATAGWGSLISGAGVWIPSGATATYTWPGTQSSFTVWLRQSAVLSLTVNANDTFVTEDATEDPAISFVNSAFRVSNGANAALAVGNQIAAKPSNAGTGSQALFLQAIRTDTVTGACVSVFPSGAEVDINVGAQCNNPATCSQNVTLTTTSGSGSPSGSFVPAGAGTYPATIRFRFTTANAEAPFFYNYADAGQITLQFRHITAAPAATIAGTSNAFVTRPFGLAFRGANSGTAIQHGTLATSPLLAAAGDPFTMTLAAYRWVGAEDDGAGNPLPGADLTDNGLTPNFASSTMVSATANLPGVNLGALARGVGCAGAATIAAGSWSGGAATIGDWCYSEAGNVFLGATASNYISAGVDVAGNSGLDGTGAAGGHVGRFRPKHFVVTGAPTLTNREALACASTFTYMNEGLRLGFTLEARNAQNVLTQNYTGAYARLNLASAASLGIGARSGAMNLTPRVDNGVAPSGSFASGVAANITATTGITRAVPDDPDGPYPGTQFGIAPADADGVLMQSYDQDVDGVGGNDHFAVGPATELRFGRLMLQNVYGTVGQTLPVPIEVQYWNGSAFVRNTLDNCTTLARANIALAFSGVIAACSTFVQQASIAFSSGTAPLTLSPSGAGNTGTVLLTPQLGTAAGTYCPASPGGTAAATASPAVYLLGRWNDAANPDADGSTSHDDKPSGQAGFGLYGSQPRNFIFFRENF